LKNIITKVRPPQAEPKVFRRSDLSNNIFYYFITIIIDDNSVQNLLFLSRR